MGNLLSAAISNGFDPIFTYCKEKASYIWNLEDNLDALQKALEDLTQAKEDVMTRITIAEQQQLRRLNRVQLWLTRVQAVETQVGELQRVRSQEIEKLCLGGYCSENLKSSYEFGKKVVDLLKVVADLKGEGATYVMDVAERIPEDQVERRPSEPTVGLESKFDQVWSYIIDEQVKIIGIYGKGGVGKTTLLTQINNKFLSLTNNYVVIWVQVSKDLRLEKIQETIAKKIGLSTNEWKSKPFEEKATDIFRILSRKKFVLLLDDIWERVNLINIGIPPPSQEIDFKVVFTTRSIEVSNHMGTHKKVEVELLTHAEAWLLFQKKVGEETLTGNPDIRILAEIVARECGGLPLALITIGRAMAGNNQPEEWRYAISILRMSAHEFPGMENDVYCLLKFSYDRLPSDVYRSCFLYCSLFPEDYCITKRDLIDCWIGEGFLRRYDGILARNFGYNIIGFLLRACLLEEGENDDDVKMHDVIRDMALWIACEIQEEKFLIRSGAGLTRAPVVREWENVKRMSLMKNDIKNLSEIPNCPELLTLFLHENPLGMLTSGFFQYMPHLQVLNLSNTCITKLPVEISKLVGLQHLDLSWSKIEELPEELKALTNLKSLNLEDTNYLCKIPRHVISNLSMLRVLRMFNFGYNISIEPEDSILFDECELLINELVSLEHLNVFSPTFKNSRALRRFLNSHVLQNCRVESLSLHLNDGSSSLNVLSLGFLKDLGALYIRSEHLVDMVIDSEMRNVPQFHGLHTVRLYFCTKLRDATWLIFAPNLKILEISFCYEVDLKTSRTKDPEPVLYSQQVVEEAKTVGEGDAPEEDCRKLTMSRVGCTDKKKTPDDKSSSSAVYEPDVAPGGCRTKTEGQNRHNEDAHMENMSSASNDVLPCKNEAQKKSDNISYSIQTEKDDANVMNLTPSDISLLSIYSSYIFIV
ncbi:hypothetical protein LWI28_016865 [Acer negundo]|uniref:AAA+ ATPase domain-containing protein n=1 Tax=Acer negundo TaxID=4023 RepID=A0AAD5IFK3_ACENE|nr:hypothetical protein LWI28_016865 [Acer negundo]